MKKFYIVFDLNHTLLSIESINDQLIQISGWKEFTAVWKSKFESIILTKAQLYPDKSFKDILTDSFLMSAYDLGGNINDPQVDDLVNAFTLMQPHADVTDSLSEMQDVGMSLNILSNSSTDILRRQVKNSKIGKYFDNILSAETYGGLKPEKEVYKKSLRSVGIVINKSVLISSHPWDIAGASQAKLKTVYLERNIKSPLPGYDGLKKISSLSYWKKL
ncbi:MAG: HAD-IA family hydrolase [Cyclobacteriaceae bacterium]|nr:HAD-IA family hydrolase [Cyclobacteriaceae bacterium]MCH8517698.1 HAD-IA family hydrolase [Cyclobacteriaceae bacterium]